MTLLASTIAQSAAKTLSDALMVTGFTATARPSRPADKKMLVMGTTQALQHWQDGRPIETIWKMPGQPLPEAEALSAEIPCDEPFADGAMNVHCKHKSTATVLRRKSSVIDPRSYS